MSKNQKETKKFPKMKVILSTVLAFLFGGAARAKASTLDLELKRKRGEQEIENAKLIAQAQAEAIKQGKYAPVPETVVVQDLKALGSVRDLMQPNK